MADEILEDRPGPGLHRITLNQPGRRNPLSSTMMGRLCDALDAVREDAAVRCVILAAAGPAFSAGHDLKELAGHRGDRERTRALFDRCASLMERILHLPQPVVAQVQGIASAAGCQLVATCDLAVAADTARFVTPGVDIGLFCSTPMVAVSRNLPRKRVMEMLLTGEALDAPTAVELGLVNRCVAPADLEAETLALAGRIAAKPASTVRIGKQAFYRQVELPTHEAYAYTAGVMALNMLEEDAGEGIAAFLEKRDPAWRRGD